MPIIIFLLSVLLCFATIVAIYLYYRQEIKVWLFAKGIFLSCVNEDEIDKDKIYDAFISYSHKDENFVVHQLVPKLESGPNPYKLCLHMRNWIPGEFIAKQVTNSVCDSRRTIVVLSASFLESVWGKMEFRTAHTKAMKEGCARVIVIKLGEINEKMLDNELKSYFSTNTYLVWGDPYFWNKLWYALPHRKRLRKQNGQKRANIIHSLEKRTINRTDSIDNPLSTPPVTLQALEEQRKVDTFASKLLPTLPKDRPNNSDDIIEVVIENQTIVPA